MRRKFRSSGVATALILCGSLVEAAQQPTPGTPAPSPATVREYKQTFRTYPFSDPNPIPVVGRIYPYFRFDGYTNQPVDQEWTVVELENQYLRVLILPEIGGKIWAAIEKSTGRPFIYYNRVVKFRDIAMRGPWTSGGIEANYGIIGHTPNCATPVDYLARTNPDGSASVFIGVLDLLTRTPWRLEVNLPADRAYFTTRSLWHNQTPLEQPYYTWMNAGLPSAGNLQFVYPGTHYLGHDGEYSSWPRHPTNGKDLSFYEQNDFGPYKSYHVFGTYTDFFGAYWHDLDFGMGRYAARADKAGKKIWIWGLSQQGMIWEKLLTDADGQYVEVQSGRLFNQSAERSSRTPFKHRGFAPYATDTWTEYWFPVKGTRGLVAASDLGALNVTHEGSRLVLSFSPLQPVRDTIEVFDGERRVHAESLSLAPLQTWTTTLEGRFDPGRVRVTIGGPRLEYDAHPDAGVLSRPLASPPNFDWDSVFGLHLKGKELIRQRSYVEAQAALEACLRKDPHYVPALVDLAGLRHRALDYQGAVELAKRALAIDTYDPGANQAYGLASRQLGRMADAMDGFDLAALSPEYRAAAWTELARAFMQQGNLARALESARRSLETNRLNVDAISMLAVIHRLQGDHEGARTVIAELLALDPLNHFARFEQALDDGSERARAAFVSGVRNEMPHETFLELAAWYRGLGRPEDAERVLALAPTSPEVLYWRAFLAAGRGDPEARGLLGRANASSPRLAFPFRAETASVLQWAVDQGREWQPRYYLALVHWGLGNVARARELLESCGDTPDYAPFYAARAQVLEPSSPDRSLADLRTAASVDATQWRFGKLLAERYLEAGDHAAALETARRYHVAAPGNYVLGMLHAKALMRVGRHGEAADLLGRLQVLPYEGSTEGRRLYREAQLMLAVDALASGRPEDAARRVGEARRWPENLGAGKPYPQDVDERLEDWLDAQCLMRLGRVREAEARLSTIATARKGDGGVGGLLGALALRALGRQDEAAARLDEWVGPAPDEPLATWGRRVWNGERPPVPARTTEEVRVLGAWVDKVGP